MKKWIWIIIGIVLLLATALLMIFVLVGNDPPSTQTGEFGPPTTAVQMSSTTTTRPIPIEEYVSPVDFKSLQAINPDIYAWIEMPGADIHYPVVQSDKDDSFYVDHDSDKQYNINGAIFTEKQYNSKDFSDSVTVLYGHNMKSGAMFGNLQSRYWDETYLRENDEIVIYLPDRELHYEIFAALPYSRMHLLHYYHTEKQRPFSMLIDDIYSSRHLNTVLLEDRRPQFGDRIIVLSTCLSGDNRYRYLVLGVQKSLDR